MLIGLKQSGVILYSLKGMIMTIIMVREGICLHADNPEGVGTGSGLQVHKGPLFHQALQAQS